MTDQDSLPSSPTEKPVDALIKEVSVTPCDKYILIVILLQLSYLHKILLLHVVESELISQIFKQVSTFKFPRLIYSNA